MEEQKILALMRAIVRDDSEHAALRTIYYKDGYILGGNELLMIRCSCGYGEEKEGGRYRPNDLAKVKGKNIDFIELVSPYRQANDLIKVGIDTDKGERLIDALKAMAGGNLNDLHTIAVNYEKDERRGVMYFKAETFLEFLSVLKVFGSNVMFLRKERPGVCLAYARAEDGSEAVIAPCPNGGGEGHVMANLEGGINTTILEASEVRLQLERTALLSENGSNVSDKRVKTLERYITTVQSAIKDPTNEFMRPRISDSEEKRLKEDIKKWREYINASFLDETSDTPIEVAVTNAEEDCNMEEKSGKESTQDIANDFGDFGNRKAGRRVCSNDWTPRDELTERMTAALQKTMRRKAERIAAGDSFPYYSKKKFYPMTIEQIEEDKAELYCIYRRKNRDTRFMRATKPEISGKEAADTFRYLKKEAQEGMNDGLAYQIRHKQKGILLEYYWTRVLAGMENIGGISETTQKPAEEKEGRQCFPYEPVELYTFVRREAGLQAASILKHMTTCGIRKWEDLTKEGLYRLRDEFRTTCAPASAKTYMATLKSFLARHEDDKRICPEYRDILKCKADKPMKAWLDKEEIKRFEMVETNGDIEAAVKARFLIGAYTGMRVSDAMDVRISNERGGMLTYVSQKTGTEATVPCPQKVKDLIAFVQANDCQMSLMYYNKKLRELCKRAGIDMMVKTHHGGKTEEGPKWKFVSSHTARISFATNLANLGVPLIKLAGMMGHATTMMTERYIAGKTVHLSARAMTYFE